MVCQRFGNGLLPYCGGAVKRGNLKLWSKVALALIQQAQAAIGLIVFLLWGNPVFYRQPFHTAKLARVVGHQHPAFGTRVGGVQKASRS